jgi:(p)ppGpp synthase/HD superfamily hydrolase
MHGYSDRIHHAFAFAAKHYVPRAPATGSADFIAHPGNLAVILSRYSADQPTVVAGILHLVLEETRPERRLIMEQSIGIKFGSVVLAVARDAAETRFDARGFELPWRAVKNDYLAHLGVAEPRAVDICVADEIHSAGLTLTALRRLGAEYVRTVSSASSEQTIWWYRSLLELLEDRPDWHRPEMLEELRVLSTDVVRALRAHED